MAPRVDPANITLDSCGQVRRHWFVRLLAGMTADDLKEPGVWCRSQSNVNKSFKPLDRLFLVAYDESWIAEAIVATAEATFAVLAGIKIVNLPIRTTPLFSDDNYRVVWNGVGYCVERIKDGHRMTGTVATQQLAERDLRNLYPQPVGH